MGFKLGNRSSKPTHRDGVRVVQTPLESGTIAEARNDGTIAVNPSVNPKSALMKRVMKHEMKHMRDMQDGKSDYGENWLMWDGKVYLRRTIDGEKVIDGPAGRLPEGHKDHPWEKEAIAAEKE